MTAVTLQQLVSDADLVARVGASLGRIRDDGYWVVLSDAKQALAKGVAAPELVATLQKTLNSAIRDLSPITLGDLRSGWTPFAAPSRWDRVLTIAFGLFGLALLAGTAYLTQVYDRARSLYAHTLELQDARGAEQAIRLFGLLRKNQQDVIESLHGGSKDFLYEAFNRALFDLEVMNSRSLAYYPIASEVLTDLDVAARLRAFVGLHPPGAPTAGESFNPSGNPAISSWVKDRYGKPLPAGAAASASTEIAALTGMSPPPPARPGKPDVQELLRVYFEDVREFMAEINVHFNPLVPNDYSWYLSQLLKGISWLGSWALPALYGMLGAVIFHMRRILDPSLPNPSWLRFAFRILLAGFAGVIVVLLWTPSAKENAPPAFASFTSFGLAFLVGYSTDVFFEGLDRLVGYVSQAVGKVGS